MRCECISVMYFFVSLWNIARALVKPNVLLLLSKSPSGPTVKVVFLLHFLANPTKDAYIAFSQPANLLYSVELHYPTITIMDDYILILSDLHLPVAWF